MITDSLIKMIFQTAGTKIKFKTSFLGRADCSRPKKICWLSALIAVGLIFLLAPDSWGADPGFSTPYFSIGVNNTEQPGVPTVTLQIFSVDDGSFHCAGDHDHGDFFYPDRDCPVIIAPGTGYHANAAESDNDRVGFVFNLFYYDTGLATN